MTGKRAEDPQFLKGWLAGALEFNRRLTFPNGLKLLREALRFNESLWKDNARKIKASQFHEGYAASWRSAEGK